VFSLFGDGVSVRVDSVLLYFVSAYYFYVALAQMSACYAIISMGRIYIVHI